MNTFQTGASPSNPAMASIVASPSRIAKQVLSGSPLKREKAEPMRAEVRAGINMPVAKVSRFFRGHLPKGQRLARGTSVYLAAALEFILMDLSEKMVDAALLDKKTRIKPAHISHAITMDRRHYLLNHGVTLLGGRERCFIHALNAKTPRQAKLELRQKKRERIAAEKLIKGIQGNESNENKPVKEVKNKKRKIDASETKKSAKKQRTDSTSSSSSSSSSLKKKTPSVKKQKDPKPQKEQKEQKAQKAQKDQKDHKPKSQKKDGEKKHKEAKLNKKSATA